MCNGYAVVFAVCAGPSLQNNGTRSSFGGAQSAKKKFSTATKLLTTKSVVYPHSFIQKTLLFKCFTLSVPGISATTIEMCSGSTELETGQASL